MNDKIIKDCLDQLKNYNFNEPTDILIFLIGYLSGIEDYEFLINILKMIYDLM